MAKFISTTRSPLPFLKEFLGVKRWMAFEAGFLHEIAQDYEVVIFTVGVAPFIRRSCLKTCFTSYALACIMSEVKSQI